MERLPYCQQAMLVRASASPSLDCVAALAAATWGIKSQGVMWTMNVATAGSVSETVDVFIRNMGPECWQSLMPLQYIPSCLPGKKTRG